MNTLRPTQFLLFIFCIFEAVMLLGHSHSRCPKWLYNRSKEKLTRCWPESDILCRFGSFLRLYHTWGQRCSRSKRKVRRIRQGQRLQAQWTRGILSWISYPGFYFWCDQEAKTVEDMTYHYRMWCILCTGKLKSDKSRELSRKCTRFLRLKWNTIIHPDGQKKVLFASPRIMTPWMWPTKWASSKLSLLDFFIV